MYPDAGMEDKLPPEALAQMQKGMAALETMRNVPEEHKAIVAPLAPQIDAWAAAHSPAAGEAIDNE